MATTKETKPMEKVTAYRSINGFLHETEEACRLAEELLLLKKWFYSVDVPSDDFDDFASWLICNKKQVKKIFELFDFKGGEL
jgi:hypothetical protein